MIEIEPIKKLWRMPRGLRDYGKIFYKKAGEYLVKEAIIADLDRSSFEILCKQYDMVMNIKEQLNRELPSPKDRYGSEKKNILISIFRSEFSSFEKWSKKFFLTPKIRANLKIDPNLSVVNRGKGKFFK